MTINSYAQTITKDDFKTVSGTAFGIIKHLKTGQVDDVKTHLKLSDSDSDKLTAQIKKITPNTSAYTLPHFYLTERPNTFKAVIICFEIVKKEEEDLHRGIYYFVIKSMVDLDPENLAIRFYDSKILTTSEGIHPWWLSQCKGYLKETKKVHNKYGFVPPPPPLPPIDLK